MCVRVFVCVRACVLFHVIVLSLILMSVGLARAVARFGALSQIVLEHSLLTLVSPVEASATTCLIAGFWGGWDTTEEMIWCTGVPRTPPESALDI